MYEPVVDFYEKLIAKHGVCSSTGFSHHGQVTRFCVLTKQINDHYNRHNVNTLLDFGCNVGDFGDYLASFGPSNIRYTGIDILQQVIQEAKKKHPGRKFICGNILDDKVFAALPVFDFIVASGTFNVKYPDCVANNNAILTRLWERTGNMMLVNFLSADYAPHVIAEHKDKLHFTLVGDAVRFAESVGCHSFCILKNYLKNDFTLVMSRKWNGP